MSNLEILLLCIIYLILGIWVCYKRNWYKNQNLILCGVVFYSIFAIILMPINLIIVLFCEFIIKDWEN